MKFVNKEVVDVIFADKGSEDRAFARGFARGMWVGAILTLVIIAIINHLG